MTETKKDETTEETATVKKAMISQPMAGKTAERSPPRATSPGPSCARWATRS